ncbi:unnamed protein product [Camellia sinensis]
MDRVRCRLQFSHKCYVDPEGLWGGLALWWTDEVDIEVRLKSKHFFRCVVGANGLGQNWAVSFVYAPPNRQFRNEFWGLLRGQALGNRYPWLCVGDFNQVSSMWEKQGGLACSSTQIANFQAMLSDCALMDLEFNGNAFTWSNNQVGLANVQERLDKAFATADWRALFPYAQVFHESRIGSDHCPVIIKCCVPPKKIPYQFKFETMWSTSPWCGDVIKQAWEQCPLGSPMFQLIQRLKNCRRSLLAWCKEDFGNTKLEIARLKERMDSLQGQPPSEDNILEQSSIQAELEVSLAREEMFFHQRSRVNWLSYGDKNSAFFFATFIQQRQRNQLLRLQSEEGVWLDSDEEINQQLHGYFANLFSTGGVRDMEEALAVVQPVITRELNERLTRNVTDEEIKTAVFQLGPVKAPGPDGYPGFFYQQYWEEVGPKVCRAICSFFDRGFLLKEMNQTNLVLIPKVKALVKSSQYRPISLCNFHLKIITKVLANHLKSILAGIISPNQSTFVPGRLIQDNLLVAHEAFHFLKLQKTGQCSNMAVKLDFNKAYDRVEWDFLESVLRKMGFHERWIRWVMECVSTVTFSVFVNGAQRTCFKPTRGLRQGDPLSPYLFILVIEVLSKLLHKSLRDHQFAGIKVRRSCPTLSHLLFADDALLFLKADLGQCRNVLQVLEMYCKASGQSINFDKSGIQFSSSVRPLVEHQICELMQMKLVKAGAKYLGLPSCWGQ